MALQKHELKNLMLATAKAYQAPTADFSFNGTKLSAFDLNDTLRKELNELAGDINSYRRNQLDIFELGFAHPTKPPTTSSSPSTLP